MKKEQQQKLVYILCGPLIAIIILSSLIAGKYPDYVDYVSVGLMAVAGLLYGLAVFLVLKKET